MNYLAETVPNIPDKVDYWAQDLVECIRRNFRTQGIFPYTDRNLYYGSDEPGTSAYRKGWKSTGAAFDMLHATVVAASDSKAQIDLFFMYYLEFVDMGVGYNIKKEDVFSGNNYHHDRRYAENWSRVKPANTVRPVLKMELTHTQRRMMKYMETFYSISAPAMLVHDLGGEIQK